MVMSAAVEQEDMDPAVSRRDPFTEYLLGASLVILIIGSVGGLAQFLHFSELPSLAYTATILVPVIGLFTAALVYQRFLSHRPVGTETADSGESDSGEHSELVSETDSEDESDAEQSAETGPTTETSPRPETDIETEGVTDSSTERPSE